MKRYLIAGMVVALVLSAAGTAVAATVGSIADAASAKSDTEWTISGTVQSVDGNGYVLSDGVGTISVDFGPHWYKSVGLNVGEAVTVTGEIDRGKAQDKPAQLDAYSVTRADKTVVEVRKGPGKPPWAGTGGPKGKAGGKSAKTAPDDGPDTETD
jgi:uncharacterized protein YdeI (BOF family)